MFTLRWNLLRFFLCLSAIGGALLLAVQALSQIREIPSLPGGGIHTPLPPVNGPINTPGLTPGVGVTTPGLGGISSYPGSVGTSAGGYSGGSSTSFTPDAMTPQVQEFMDQLFKEKLDHLPAVEKTRRNRR